MQVTPEEDIAWPFLDDEGAGVILTGAPDRRAEEKPAGLAGTHQHFPSSRFVIPEGGERDWLEHRRCFIKY
jgi:hypothetical protein